VPTTNALTAFLGCMFTPYKETGDGQHSYSEGFKPCIVTFPCPFQSGAARGASYERCMLQMSPCKTLPVYVQLQLLFFPGMEVWGSTTHPSIRVIAGGLRAGIHRVLSTWKGTGLGHQTPFIARATVGFHRPVAHGDPCVLSWRYKHGCSHDYSSHDARDGGE
jgi:hypothetical protein